MSEDIQKNYVWTYRKTIRRYNHVLSTSSVDEISEKLEKYRNKLNPLEFKILRMRLEGRSLESIGNEVNLTRESIRKREGYVLEQLRFYSLTDLKNYTKDQVVNMNVSDFVDLIPLERNYSNTALKNVLLKNFKNHKVSYLVDNFGKLVACYDIGTKYYETLRNLLLSYDIEMPDVAVFNSVKYKRRKRVR